MAFTFDPVVFRELFPAFKVVNKYPDATLELNYGTAVIYLTENNYGLLVDDARQRALYLMAAHLTALNDLIAAGQTPGQIQGATIDKVTVTMTPPPQKNQFDWWLGLTPYGQQLYALLQLKSVGGMYVPAYPSARGLR